jgi:hypothetical protein
MELPERPALAAEVAAQCPQELAVVAGRPLPSGLVDAEGRATCGGVLVPTSVYADLLNLETAYGDLRAWSSLELARYGTLLDAADRDAAWWKTEATRPVPVTLRPWFNWGLGAGTVLVSAYALHLVESP